MTARDQARRWLAETLRSGDHELSDIGECGRESARLAAADAILDAPGVTVDERRVRFMGDGWGFLADDETPTHTQIAIRLPAVPLDSPRNLAESRGDVRVDLDRDSPLPPPPLCPWCFADRVDTVMVDDVCPRCGRRWPPASEDEEDR